MNVNFEQAYALGLIWADGYLCDQRNEIRLEVVSDDFVYFEQPLSSLGRLEIQQRNRINRRPQTRGVIRDKSLTNRLISWNFKNKSVQSPTSIFNLLHPSCQQAFILGWVDGDGCFYINEKNKSYQFVMSGSYDQDWTVLINLCRVKKITFSFKQTHNKSGNYSQFRITNKSGLIKFIDWLYKAHNLGLPRKRNKANQILAACQ